MRANGTGMGGGMMAGLLRKTWMHTDRGTDNCRRMAVGHVSNVPGTVESCRRCSFRRSWRAGILLLLAMAYLASAGSVRAQDAMKTSDFKQAVADARMAMSERDLAAAETHLSKAGRCVQTPDEEQELTRLAELLDYQKQFWEILRAGVAKLQSGEELVLKTTRVAVVEASRDELLVKAEGRMFRYRVEDMPTSLVTTIAARSLAKNATSKVALGVFLLFDKKGDRKLAAKLWQDAAQAGVAMDRLLPELDLEPGPGGGQTPVPKDEAALRQAETSVRTAYVAQYAGATTPPAQEDLAKKLLAAAPTGESTEARFVMFRQARDLAVSAGNPALACDAIDQTAQVFQVDALAMKVSALEEIGKNARRLAGQREIVESVLKLLQEAIEAGRLDEGRRLSEVGRAAAQKLRNRMLMQQISAAEQQLKR